MRTKQLPQDYALVLQQLSEDGGDALEDLAAELRLERARLSHVIRSLHHKGLVMVRQGVNAQDMWVTLSAKGRRLMAYLWPESRGVFAQ